MISWPNQMFGRLSLICYLDLSNFTLQNHQASSNLHNSIFTRVFDLIILCICICKTERLFLLQKIYTFFKNLFICRIIAL